MQTEGSQNIRRRIRENHFRPARTIVSMIAAPLLHFVIGQLVVVIYTLLVYQRLIMTGDVGAPLGAGELLAQVTEAVNSQTVLLTMISSLITLPVVYIFFFEKRQPMFAFVRPVSRLLWMLPFGASICISVNMLISLSGLAERFRGYDELAKVIYGGSIWFEFLGIALLPALLEELIFRGVIYRGLRRWMPAGGAMLVSALLFGAMHMNMVQFVYASCLGFVFAWVCERYQTLWAPILMHFAANSCSILMTEWEPLMKLLNTQAGAMGLLTFLFLCDIGIPVLIMKKHRTPVLSVLKNGEAPEEKDND